MDIYIQNAIQSIENMRTCQGDTASSGEFAITNLRSATRLLGSLTASPSDTASFLKVSDTLQRCLLPALRSYPISPSLNYIVSLLQLIDHKQPSVSNCAPDKPNAWENISILIFARLLDFLENNSNSSISEQVGTALYPVLCPIYFNGRPVHFHAELLSMVYQTLTTTITSHPVNAAKLRNILDRMKLGFAISQTKVFLALESLLELFGSLIPSVKGGRAKRTTFIKEVFDLSIFKDAGKQIHEILEDISSPDWSVTSDKIVKALALHDTSFPQPFEAQILMFNEIHISSLSPFYVDNMQFIANIDKAGAIETLCVPFSTITHISNSLKGSHVHVTLGLKQPPIFGNRPMDSTSKENNSLSWNLSKVCFSNLVETLKSRGIKTGKLFHDKLSKGKPIELDFQLPKIDPDILTQTRMQQLSQSWALDTPPNSGDKACGPAPTSPLIPNALTELVQMPRAIQPNSTSPSPPTVFLDSGGNLSMAPKAAIHPATTADMESDSLDQLVPIKLFPNTSRQALSIQNDVQITDYLESEKLDSQKIAIPPAEQDPPRRKRTIKEIEADEAEVETTEAPPLKRNRLIEGANPSSAKLSKTVKYSRKKLPSSPASDCSPTFDFDEIPASTINAAGTSEMKPKRGKDAKLVDSTGKNSIQVKSKGGDHKQKTTKSKNNSKYKRQPIVAERPHTSPTNQVRRSARVAKLQPPKEAPNEMITVLKSSGHQQAPWDDPHFLEKAKIQSDISDYQHTTEEDARASLGADSRVGDVPVVDTYFEPEAKMQPPNQDIKSEDVEVIDLTRGQSLSPRTSPQKAQKQRISFPVKISEEESSKAAAVAGVNLTSDHIVRTAALHRNLLIAPTGSKSHKPIPKKIEPLTVVPQGANEQPKGAMKRVDTDVVQMAPKASMDTRTAPEKISPLPAVYEHARDMPEGNGTLFTTLNSRSDHSRVARSAALDRDIVTTQSSPPKRQFNREDIDSAPDNRRDANARRSVNFTVPHLELSSKIQIPSNPASRGQVPLPYQAVAPEQGYPERSNRHIRPRKQFAKVKQDPMEKIISVVQQINAAIVRNIENRFEKVTESLTDGQRRMLEDTTAGLQDMYQDSVQYFNDLVDLEENYSLRCNALDVGTHDYIKTSEQLSQCFRNVSLDHSRHSLSKVFPSSLFPKTPGVVAKIKL